MSKDLLLCSCSQIAVLESPREENRIQTCYHFGRVFRSKISAGVYNEIPAWCHIEHGCWETWPSRAPPTAAALAQTAMKNIKVWNALSASIYFNSLQRNWWGSDVWFVSAHLGSSPAEQCKSKLADGRDHQVHSDSSPRPVSGLQSIFMNFPGYLVAVIITLTLGAWTGLRIGIRFDESLCASFWVCCSGAPFQFKDGKTPLKSVHVGGRLSGTVLRLQVRVFCGFLVQKETLVGENSC